MARTAQWYAEVVPYASNEDLPPAVRSAYSSRCQSVFREAFNRAHERDGEEAAFRVGHTAAKRCEGKNAADAETKAVLDTAAREALPDSAYACPEKRLYPHHHRDGSLDLVHLRAALSRIGDTSNDQCGKAHLEAHAEAAGIGDRKEAVDSRRVREIKAFTPTDFTLDEEGAVAVKFAQLNVVDSDDDITPNGAIPTKDVPMSAYAHKSWPKNGGLLPVGRGTVREKGDSAIFEGRFFTDTTHGRDTYLTVKHMGELQEWSYGYEVLDSDRQKGKRVLKKLDIFEVSPVLSGAGVGTQTLAIKSAGKLRDSDDELPDGESFADHLDRVLIEVSELQKRASDVVSLRTKEGRALSSARRERLLSGRDLLKAILDDIDELLRETEPRRDEEDAKRRLMRMQAKLAEARTMYTGARA
jgi:cation transport regulator ChaB